MKNHVQHNEILNTLNKTGIRDCLFTGKVEYLFENHCKGYILNLSAGQLTLPRSSKETIGLLNPFILLQLFLYPGKLLTLEFCISDSDGVRRRLIFTQGKQIIRNVMHSRIPNQIFNKNIWTNLCIDLSSVFTLCFPKLTFRSLEGIFISGTLKLRKIISLASPAEQLLPGISEAPKFVIVSQNVDSGSFPQHGPAYYSSSPVSHKKKSEKMNIFKKSDVRVREIGKLKREFMVRANIGPKALFRSPKIKQSYEEILRKITHLHNKDPDEAYEIEESIEAERNSWEEELMKKMPSRVYESPEFYVNKCLQICSVRHMTPPFVYSKDNISYNPFFRYYENL